MTSDSKSISKSRKMMLSQQVKAWNVDTDLNWSNLALDRPLFPVGDALSKVLNLTPSENLAMSQLFGLMAAQAISQHEQVLESAKRVSWEVPAHRYSMDDDLRELGEEFFSEERKHALAFARYVHLFADRQQLQASELSRFLPSYESKSFLAKVLTINGKLGGRAIWWLVMLTEEESIAVFKALQSFRSSIDPLYFNLHRLHYEEEIRHMSYAPLMLRFLDANAPFRVRMFAKFDFALMYVVHFCWVVVQCLRLRKLRAYDGKNPFMIDLKSAYLKARSLPFVSLIKLALAELPWFRQLLAPMRHQSIRSELNRSKPIGWNLMAKSVPPMGSLSVKSFVERSHP